MAKDRTFSTPDFGTPAKIIYYSTDSVLGEVSSEADGTTWTLRATASGRYDIKIVQVRESGQVQDIWIQRVSSTGGASGDELTIHLEGQDAQQLVNLFRNLAFAPVTSGDQGDDLAARVLANPDTVNEVYRRSPEAFRANIAEDPQAQDVVALANRRTQLDEFRKLLSDSEYFDRAMAAKGGRPEAVWQEFIERNPWILGFSLGGQALVGVSEDRLEQVVAGYSVAGPGKRVDALLQTAGRIRSMVFLEIKHHRTNLLGREYRSGCFAPSDELSGGVAQIQGTVQRAMLQLGEKLQLKDADGFDKPNDVTYLFRPRSFLIVGSLDEFASVDGGHSTSRIQSFELYRRHLDEPEIVTFDELLARAEWIVGTSESRRSEDAPVEAPQ